MADYVNFNGINKAMVHEHTREDGTSYFSVGISPVPFDFSRNGVANVISNKVQECKSDANKVNVGFPEDWKLKVSVASYYNEKEPDKTKYKTVEMTAKELESKVIEARKAIKDAKAAKEAEAATEEAEGPEIG